MINMLEAIFLGALQGLTEFLPISSSAHLRIAGEFFNQDPGAKFTAITQIGTELAVLIYFRHDIKRIISAWVKKLISSSNISESEKKDARLGWMIVIGSLPIAIIGYLAQDAIKTEFRSLWIVATVLIVFGFILGLADHFGEKNKQISELTVKHGVLYGLAQSLALVPGVSRSGATIAMGRILGYTREAALRYSFLLAMPAVFGSGLYELYQAFVDESDPNVYSLTETFVATTVAFFIGYLVIAWLLKFVTTKSFMPFIVYRIALGLGLFALLAAGVINA